MKKEIYLSISEKLINSCGIKFVERYYEQYSHLTENNAALNNSCYIDISEINYAKNEEQKGNSKFYPNYNVAIYCNVINVAQSFRIVQNTFVGTIYDDPNINASFADWDLEQSIINNLHQFSNSNNGVKNMLFINSEELQRYDQLLVKKINFTVYGC